MEIGLDFFKWLKDNKVTDYARPDSFYDYDAAYKLGIVRDKTGHFDSRFKKLGHPNLIVDGIDTRTGKPANLALQMQNRAAYEKVLLDMLKRGVK